MSFLVQKAQGRSVLVDRGRTLAQAVGLSQGGALDEYSYLWANRLLNNRPNDAALEITLGNLTLVAQAPTHIALTGANIPVTLNQSPLPLWQSIRVNAGDVIKVGFFQGRGTRLYLAVKDGFHAPYFFQSQSCVIREQLGGHNHGQVVCTGDSLAYSAVNTPLVRRSAPTQFHKLSSPQQELRFIPSYQYALFSEAARQQFTHSTYELTPHMDKMGFRLQGSPIPAPRANIQSEGIALGSIQITPQGQPMVLMSDRQNIGGYPKVGVVYRVDLSLLAQCAPGQQLQFVEGSLAEAWQLQQQREAFFAKR